MLGRWSLLLSFGFGVACGPAGGAEPDRVLDAYARAIAEGRSRDAYVLLSSESKKSIPFDKFERALKDNPEEVRELVQSLRRPQVAPPRVTASVPGPQGEATILLLYEQGAWRVDASTIDLYGQHSPEAAARSFVRAYDNRRFDVLLAFVPEEQRDGLTASELKQAWEGPERADMDRLVAALRAALPTAKLESFGDRATLPFGGGGSVDLVRERGVWKIEDLK